MITECQLTAALPFVPPLHGDESLWSWITRIALYWGEAAEEWIDRLGCAQERWELDSPPTDFDCAPGSRVVEQLSLLTDVPSRIIQEHVIPRGASTLWLDDRIAFCERCFDEMSVSGSPYVRSAWLDAWCINCPIHRTPLCTVQEAHRAGQRADWNRVWVAKISWAAATLARLSDPHPGLIEHGEVVLWYPPIDCLANDPRVRYRKAKACTSVECSVRDTCRPDESVERLLVILAGQVFSDFSMARAFFNINERLGWRNTWTGLDTAEPVEEPLGSLTTRSCAIRIGTALTDIILRRLPREYSLTREVRELVRGLNRSTQALINEELIHWPESLSYTWSTIFGWPNRKALYTARSRERRNQVGIQHRQHHRLEILERGDRAVISGPDTAHIGY